MGDFLPRCISSSHPVSLSSCHNVVQVERHSGWRDCTILSNSLIFFFSIHLLTALCTTQVSYDIMRGWGGKEKGTRRQWEITHDKLTLHCTAGEGQAISFSKLNFSSILCWPLLQMNLLTIDHFASPMLRKTCALKHVQLHWNFRN